MRHSGPIVHKFSTAALQTGRIGRAAAPTHSVRTILAAAPPAPIEVPSNTPTGEFRTHHEVLPPQIDEGAFRPGWMVKSRLLGLYETGLIDRYQHEAALWWRGCG